MLLRTDKRVLDTVFRASRTAIRINNSIGEATIYALCAILSMRYRTCAISTRSVIWISTLTPLVSESFDGLKEYTPSWQSFNFLNVSGMQNIDSPKRQHSEIQCRTLHRIDELVARYETPLVFNVISNERTRRYGGTRGSSGEKYEKWENDRQNPTIGLFESLRRHCTNEWNE